MNEGKHFWRWGKKNNVCPECCAVEALFEKSRTDPHRSYFPTLKTLKEFVEGGKIEIFAGDCPLEEAEMHLSEEKHFAVHHYFKCSSCGQYFIIGTHIRGIPIYKTKTNLSDKEINKMLWGHYGTKYE